MQSRDITRAVWTLGGPDLLPLADPRWFTAGPAEQRRFVQFLAARVRQAKQKDLSEGRDWRGKKLRRIRPRTWEERRRRYAVWQGPPLMPQFDASRTRRLLRVQPMFGDRVIGYWPKRWARILRYHAEGRRPLPERDVIGLSEQGIRWAKRKAASDWRAWMPAPPRAAPAVAPAPRPPRPIPAPVPVAARPVPLTPGRTAAELLDRYPFLAEFNIRDVPDPPRPRGVLRRIGDAFRRLGSLFFG
jgi:hypothetical protein